MKKILFITGTRADYGKISPLIKIINDHERFDFRIFVTGMHLLDSYGKTLFEVEKLYKDKIIKYKNQDEINKESLDVILANTIKGLNKSFKLFLPDSIIIHGDRVEALAGACSGSLNNILTIHIEGGEVSGTIDELIRHSISKLSHIHLVSNKDALQRLVQMGEEKSKIHIIGSPDIDIMKSDTLPNINKVKKHYSINFSSYAIFCYHPVTTELHLLEKKINNVCEALKNVKQNFIVIQSNNDPGREIIDYSLRKNFKNKNNFLFFPSLRHQYYLQLLKHADFIIGNSSTCVREAPIYAVPSINIGSRQNGRYRFKSILNCHENKDDILNCFKLAKSLKKNKFSDYFGKGNSSSLFQDLINDNKFWKVDIQKIFIDYENI